jgi:general secretion pathway protein K
MNGRQKGIALISVLLVMSLVLLITSGLLRSHRLMLQSSAQQLQQLHLRQLVVGAEAWARLQLQDAEQGTEKTVDLTQDWARLAPAFDIEEAQISVEIEDLAGRFNLNALLKPGQIDQVTLNRWGRLQALLNLAPLQLSQVGELRELSQLRLLPGVDGQVLRQLEPWVALLPPEVALNINTAPALILRTLGEVDAALADALARQASTSAWGSVQAFTQDPMISGLGLSSHGLGIASRWFRITVQATSGERSLRLVTDVERDLKTRQLTVLQKRFLPSMANETLR